MSISMIFLFQVSNGTSEIRFCNGKWDDATGWLVELINEVEVWFFTDKSVGGRGVRVLYEISLVQDEGTCSPTEMYLFTSGPLH